MVPRIFNPPASEFFEKTFYFLWHCCNILKFVGKLIFKSFYNFNTGITCNLCGGTVAQQAVLSPNCSWVLVQSTCLSGCGFLLGSLVSSQFQKHANMWIGNTKLPLGVWMCVHGGPTYTMSINLLPTVAYSVKETVDRTLVVWHNTHGIILHQFTALIKNRSVWYYIEDWATYTDVKALLGLLTWHFCLTQPEKNQ